MSVPRPRPTAQSPMYPRLAVAAVLVISACSHGVASDGKPAPAFTTSPGHTAGGPTPSPGGSSAAPFEASPPSSAGAPREDSKAAPLTNGAAPPPRHFGKMGVAARPYIPGVSPSGTRRD